MDVFSWIKLNPSAVTGAVMALVNMVVAFGAHITQNEAAAIGTITTAVLTIIIAASTRPVGLQLLVGGATTIAGALAAFHFVLSPTQISSGATVLSLVLAVAFHLAHVPVAAVKKGTVAYALQGVGNVPAPQATGRR